MGGSPPGEGVCHRRAGRDPPEKITVLDESAWSGAVSSLKAEFAIGLQFLQAVIHRALQAHQLLL